METKYIQKIGTYDKFEELKEFILLFCVQEDIKSHGDIYAVQGIESTDGPRNSVNKRFGGQFDGQNEFEFNALLEDFEDTIVEELLEELPYKLSRTRIFSLDGREYSVHRDPSKRLHIPITTNETCVFSFYNNDKELVHTEHIPADGSIYIVDTTMFHKTGSFGNEPRIHIVGSIKE